jgi:rhomboid protease GluP
MKDIGTKIRLIFIPYLIISIATISIYTFLHWWLLIKNPIFSINQEVATFIIPMLFPGAPVLIWLRPRVKLLNLTTGGKNPLVGFIGLAWIATATTIIVSQEYLVTSTGKLTRLDNIRQINKLPLTKYYTVKQFYIDKKLARFRSEATITGKYNKRYQMDIYVTVPLFDKNHIVKFYSYLITDPTSDINSNNAILIIDGKRVAKEALHNINPKSISEIKFLKGKTATSIYGDSNKSGAIMMKTHPYKGIDTMMITDEDNRSHSPAAWLAIKFVRTISNRLSTEEKSILFKEFYVDCEKELKSMQLYKSVYFDRISRSFLLDRFEKTIDNKTNSERPVVLWPINEPFEARNGSALLWIPASFAVGVLVFFLLLLSRPLRNHYYIDQ